MGMGMHMGRFRQMPDPRARKGSLRRAVLVFKPYWRRTAIVVLAIVATAGLGLVNPVVIGLIIDQAFKHCDLHQLTTLVVIMFVTSLVSGDAILAANGPASVRLEAAAFDRRSRR